MIRTILIAAVAALSWTGAGASIANAAEPAKTEQVAQACDPTFGGKYGILLRRLNIPSDRGQYGDCRDYGRWSGSSYKGFSNLPPGAYWTYSYPHWYVWARQQGATFSYGLCGDPTFGGKYSGMLRRMRIPGDRGQYGDCRDYGRWSGNSYRGYSNLPNGFWVYSYPYWIIWAQRK